MKVEHLPAGRSRLELERYEDLLLVRCLPDYRFLDANTVETETEDLEFIGIERPADLTRKWEPNPNLFDYQRYIVERALRKERYAIFALTGLGKSLMQLEWCRVVTEWHGGRTLIVAPLSVCRQTIGEAAKFYGDSVTVADLTDRKHLDRWLVDGTGIGITNFEKFDNLDTDDDEDLEVRTLKYGRGGGAWDIQAVCIDESSALKSFGSRKFSLMRSLEGVRYKLACSATPAPNQRTEFAQHALFLGYVRSTTEYLTAYFVNRDGDWEFKAHAFDAWTANLASWAVFLHDPAKWGFSDGTKALPQLSTEYPQLDLTIEQREASLDWDKAEQMSLLGVNAGGITSRTKLQQIASGFLLDSGKVVARFPAVKPQWIADACNVTHAAEQCIVWVNYDEEGDALAAAIPDGVHISGRTPRRDRDQLVESFRAGDGPRVLILKPSMFGHGVNLQACTVQIFSSLPGDSFERYFQCVRRSYRFGQTKPVRVYIPLTQLDEAMCVNIMNKESTFSEDARAVEDGIVAKLRPMDTSVATVKHPEPTPEIARTEGATWTAIHGDSVAHLPTMADESIDLAVFSPPFAALYAYSTALGDMGNVRADAEFKLQWRWFAERLLPKMKPGRVCAIHCKEIIRFANTHGYRHCYDFPSDLREGMVAAGFNYQRRITIWKNPQLEATRNKETSLLHVTALRDACQSYPQAGEYLMVFTAPGTPEVPVTHSRAGHTFEKHTEWMNSIWNEPEVPAVGEEDMWRQWLHPDGPANVATWRGIRETDVLTARGSKDSQDEKHVCPLQLGLIARTIELWTNPGELVFTPFLGIGSEIYEAIRLGRRGYGVELKDTYYAQAVKNLRSVEDRTTNHLNLFDALTPS